MAKPKEERDRQFIEDWKGKLSINAQNSNSKL